MPSPTAARRAAAALKALHQGDLETVRLHLEALAPRPVPHKLQGPMRQVLGQPRPAVGGAWELLECGHELFVAGSRRPGTKRRRHCPTCLESEPGHG